MGRPRIMPLGVTVYQPEKCYNGYTLFPASELGAMLIDMNGKVVRLWKDLQGFPNKLLPGGQVLGHRGERDDSVSYQDKIDLVQVDWDGNIVWQFNQYEFIKGDPDVEDQWMLRQHHDYQREGNPVGYYVPQMECKVNSGNTLILVHKNCYNTRITDKMLIDDAIIEVNQQGHIIWEWELNKHFSEMGYDNISKLVQYKNPNLKYTNPVNMADWAHINSMSVLGPNRWYEQGDERFHPDNLIIDSRTSNILMIISKQTGKIVWRVGPDFEATSSLKKLGVIIGPHHAHMIPQGLPGAGNILVFDNGGWAGFGAPNQTCADGTKFYKRDYSRVLEFNPVTLEIVWQFTPSEMGYKGPARAHYFYSPLVSSAQRLPNGNTFITEGVGGHMLEVTEEHEIVWEYVSPYFGGPLGNMVYRAYRYPYEYVPQLEKPEEKPVMLVDNYTFRVPGAAGPEYDNVAVTVEGTWGYGHGGAACVQEDVK